MLTITQYREKIGLYMKKLADMNARCAAENREMTEEERSLKKELMDKVSELQDIVATEERHERLERDLRMPANAPLTQPRPEGQPPESRKERFKSLGEQLVAAVRAAQPGSPVDPRLLEVRATGLNESVPSEGGFLVQTDFSNELLQQVFRPESWRRAAGGSRSAGMPTGSRSTAWTRHPAPRPGPAASWDTGRTRPRRRPPASLRSARSS